MLQIRVRHLRTNLKEEIDNMTKKEIILNILQDKQPHHASEFVPITHRFSAVIKNLRDEGYNIVTIAKNSRDESASYQLF